MNLMDDAYYRMIESKLADALSNLTYYEKEYKQALGKCQVITKQLEDYKKLVGIQCVLNGSCIISHKLEG